MIDFLNQSVDYATLIGMTAGIMQIVKMTDKDGKFNRFYPVASVLIGTGLGLFAGAPWMFALAIGLAASGVYNIVKKTVMGN